MLRRRNVVLLSIALCGAASPRSITPKAAATAKSVAEQGAVDKARLGGSTKALRYKTWTQWDPPTLKAGDCRSKTPPPPLTLTLYSDGSVHWRAQVFSSDTHDTWNGSFLFKSADGRNQGTSGGWRYHMNLSQPTIYTWEGTKGPSATLAANFDLIVSVTFQYSC
jgi:hypothetical protein